MNLNVVRLIVAPEGKELIQVMPALVPASSIMTNFVTFLCKDVIVTLEHATPGLPGTPVR